MIAERAIFRYSANLEATMHRDDVEAGFEKLNNLAREEYGIDLAAVIATKDEKKQVRRLARLAGIELKYPFATPKALNGNSVTGARRGWVFKRELLIPDKAGVLPLDRLKGNASYDLEKAIYDELRLRPDSRVRNMEFGSFLQDNQSESNWFLALLLFVQPYLCEKVGKKSGVPPAKENKKFWGIASTAAERLAELGVERAIEPVVHALCSLVPSLAGAPPAVAAGLALFLVHYARKHYCETEIQEEIIQILKWKNNDWEKN